MNTEAFRQLSRRERQLMDALYRLGQASVEDVRRELEDEISYDSVRVLLGILENKGHLVRWRDGRRYIYAPRVPVEKAKRSALNHVLETFFRGSTRLAVSELLHISEDELSKEELRELEQRLREARRNKGVD